MRKLTFAALAACLSFAITGTATAQVSTYGTGLPTDDPSSTVSCPDPAGPNAPNTNRPYGGGAAPVYANPSSDGDPAQTYSPPTGGEGSGGGTALGNFAQGGGGGDLLALETATSSNYSYVTGGSGKGESNAFGSLGGSSNSSEQEGLVQGQGYANSGENEWDGVGNVTGVRGEGAHESTGLTGTTRTSAEYDSSGTAEARASNDLLGLKCGRIGTP